MKRGSGRSLKLVASSIRGRYGSRNGPPDHSVRLRRTAPDPRRFDDLFEYFGSISVRRMFGGEGIYVDDLMIGIVVDDRIYLKTSDSNRPDFEAEDARPFTYHRGKDRKATSLSYYAVPDRLLDDAEEFGQWAHKAHAAALAAKKPRKTSRSRKA